MKHKKCIDGIPHDGIEHRGWPACWLASLLKSLDFSERWLLSTGSKTAECRSFISAASTVNQKASGVLINLPLFRLLSNKVWNRCKIPPASIYNWCFSDFYEKGRSQLVKSAYEQKCCLFFLTIYRNQSDFSLIDCSSFHSDLEPTE